MGRPKTKKKQAPALPSRTLAFATLDDFLKEQAQQDMLRFITCGSVDDGKSTLIGRLLWESMQLFDDQLASLQADSKKFGTQGDDIDFALLVDGLSAEREQGITIDVAYRFFATSKRKFIVADTPGHEQYTRNMVTGASTADVAVLLVDARQGILVQTRRHAYLVSLVGIKHVVLAVNKMDLVGYKAATFNAIVEAFKDFAKPLGFESITAIPLSGLKGDNIIERSLQTNWYNGPTLMSYLETVDIARPASTKLAFPVQWVNRPDSSFRGFSGTVAAGSLKLGDTVRVTGSGQTAVVAGLITMDGTLERAQAGQAVTLTLDREVDASRGDVIALADAPLEMTDQFEATLVWMHEDAGLVGRNYDIKLANQWAGASISNIKHRVNVNTLAQEACRQLALNDISVCNISTSKPLVFDRFDQLPGLGSFILVDRFNNATVAAGMIRHNLRRAQNVHKQALSITRAERETLNGHAGKVVWFTGLSGSGKSTLANAFEVALHAQGQRTYLLDGDNIRQGLNKDLGFTKADRVENIRRIAEVAKLMMDAGMIVLTAFISPYRRDRDMARELIGTENFVEVFVNTPLEVCEQRDVKGLYKKARAGLIPNFTGVNSPYEPPLTPEVEIVGAEGNILASVAQLIKQLVNNQSKSDPN
jgi:bifunctional enzyme CysN/CysC